MKPLSPWSGALLAAAILAAGISGGSQEIVGIRGFRASRVEAERELEQKLQSIPEAARAEANLRHLTSEPHMAGTDASRRVAEWLRDQYRSFGFDADIVTYSAWLPLPLEVKLEMTAPEPRTLASPEQPFEQDPDTYDKRAAPGFNTYSPSGEVTAPVVYVNYGMQDDYRELESLGVSVEGKIALARYGQGFRGIKAKLAEEHKAAGLILYSDPQDDGFVAGDTFPEGPWRPTSGVQRGSILYTELHPGDPLTPGVGPNPSMNHVLPADSATLPHIPTMPISAKDAAFILENLGGAARAAGLAGRASVYVSRRSRGLAISHEDCDGLRGTAHLRRDRQAAWHQRRRMGDPRQSSRCVGFRRGRPGKRHCVHAGSCARPWRACAVRLEAAANHCDLRTGTRRNPD
jgi:N-acetylated-alpha-linked acidic dipeptidase